MKGLELGLQRGEGKACGNSGEKKNTGRKKQKMTQGKGKLWGQQGLWEGQAGETDLRKECLFLAFWISDILLPHSLASLAPTIPAASRSFRSEAWKVCEKALTLPRWPGVHTMLKSLS